MKNRIVVIGIWTMVAAIMLYAFECAKAEEMSSMLMQENPDQYCAKMQDGQLVVVHLGKPITGDIFLKNGTTIKPDGTIITREGVRSVLREGHCIDAEGNIDGQKKVESP